LAHHVIETSSPINPNLLYTDRCNKLKMKRFTLILSLFFYGLNIYAQTNNGECNCTAFLNKNYNDSILSNTLLKAKKIKTKSKGKCKVTKFTIYFKVGGKPIGYPLKGNKLNAEVRKILARSDIGEYFHF